MITPGFKLLSVDCRAFLSDIMLSCVQFLVV